MSKKSKVTHIPVNEYNGSKVSKIKHLKIESTNAVKFFNSNVAARIPVVFDNQINDDSWHGSKWSNKYLKKNCGDAVVRVEYRQDAEDHFGKGKEKTMTFNEFIDLVENNNENVYMTTQELSYSPEGQPSIISPPLTLLRQDFPLTPKLFANLIISNINIWFGATTRPTTSGLHHDYHDNLYILLRGEKQFTLYSPAEAENMYTVGQLVKVHTNGRINYKGQITRADGADDGVDAAITASERMKKATDKLAQAEFTVDSKGFNAELLDDAENDIDDALEALLDAEMAANCGEDEDDSDEGDFDGESEEGSFGDSEVEDEDESEPEVDMTDMAKFLGIKRKYPDSSSVDIVETVNDKTATSSSPPNFSHVNTSLPDSELKAKFPLYFEARQRAITITLKAGQMLYLPAGWFHEVKSVGSSAEGGHLAFNYWFHPPDGTEYSKPYLSNFWANDFAERIANDCL